MSAGIRGCGISRSGFHMLRGWIRNMPTRLTASEWTALKQDNFRSYLRAYSAIAAAIQRKATWRTPPWFYFELTVGSGLIDNGSDVIKGSPLIALEAFREQSDFRVDCLFVEINPSYAAELTAAVEAEYARWPIVDQQRIQYEIKCLDHRKILRTVDNYRNAIGLLYWDGLGGDIFPAAELFQWLTDNPRHDLLVMASGTAQKRMGLGRPRLDALLTSMPTDATMWLTKPYGPWQWVFAMVSRWPALGKKLSGPFKLHDAKSDLGKEILDTLATTKQERKQRDQPELWNTNENP
jgi:hypothetical protein